MGNVLFVWNSLPAWTPDGAANTGGGGQKNPLEMEQRREMNKKRKPEPPVDQDKEIEVTSKEECPANISSARELRRRRRLNQLDNKQT